MSFIAMIGITLIVAEFGLHVIYHWKTGKAGMEDPAFAYLKDVWRWLHGDNA